jgi:organic radical activating enzyme
MTSTHGRDRFLLVEHCVGPVLRGEGPSAGQLAMVVQLSGCGLGCRRCDVPFTWDASRFQLGRQGRRFRIGELVEWVSSSAARLVVITGGEPLEQPAGVLDLATRLAELGYRVEIETNGTIVPSGELVAATHVFVVSPKLSGFAVGTSRAERISEAALAAFVASGRAVFCVVVLDAEDVAELVALEHRLGLYPIWVVPEGTDAVRVLYGMCWLAEHALAHGWNLGTRLHVLLNDADRAARWLQDGIRTFSAGPNPGR